MSIIDERRKKLQELKESKNYASTNTMTSTAAIGGSSRRSQLDALKAERAKTVASSLSSRVDTWLNNHNAYLNNYNSRFESRKGTLADSYVSDSGDWLETITTQKSNFDKEAQSIMSLLDTYGDYLGSDYTDSVRNALKSAQAQQDLILKNASSDRDLWSQFADENEYSVAQQDYLKQQRYEGYQNKYSGKSYEEIMRAAGSMIGDEEKDWLKSESLMRYDLNAGREEIDRLQGYADMYEEATSSIPALKILIQQKERELKYGHFVDTAKVTKELNDARNQLLRYENTLSQFGNLDINKLKGDISQKSADYTLAERAQKAAELASVADENSKGYDPDFNTYSELGQHIPYENVGSVKHKNGIAVYDDLKAATLALNEHRVGTELYTYDNLSSRGEGILGYFQGLKGVSEYNSENNKSVETFRKMNETEFATLAYYLKKDEENGTDLAAQYVESIKESLNTRVAYDIAEAKKDNLALQYVFAVEAGLDQFFEGRDAWFAGEDYIVPSATQIASGMIREDLAETGKQIEWLGGTSLGQIGYDAISTTSNMLPSILASTASNMLVPGSGAVVGAGVLGMSAGGNARAEMINLGYSAEQATSYGLMVGIAEAGMEYLLGNIPGLSKGDGIFSTLGTKVASKVDNAISRVAIALGDKGTDILKAAAGKAIGAVGGALDEALEEGLQTIIEPWLKKAATSVDWDAPNVDEVLYSSLLGAITSFGFSAGETVVQGVSYPAVQNAQAKETYGAAQGDLAAEAVALNPNNSFAKNMQAKVEGGKELSGAQLNKLVKLNEAAKVKETEESSATVSNTKNAAENSIVAREGVASKVEAKNATNATAKVNEASEGNSAAMVVAKDAKGLTEAREEKDATYETPDTKVEEITSVKDGKITVKLESGEVVDASEVDFDNEDTALVYRG